VAVAPAVLLPSLELDVVVVVPASFASCTLNKLF
jgi:hypothetical protein